ncbi:hypothetical protein AXK30_14780 [Escherichia coli]|nr:hypothetical protein AXK30_14780 [Escherichia coli]
MIKIMNYYKGNIRESGENRPDNRMLVAAKEIAGIDLICHILKLFCHTVGDNDVGLYSQLRTALIVK